MKDDFRTLIKGRTRDVLRSKYVLQTEVVPDLLTPTVEVTLGYIYDYVHI